MKKAKVFVVLENDVKPEFEGVYCDISGTLLSFANDAINVPILETLEAFELEGHSIHLWTGGNLEATQEQLDNLGIGSRWPLLSKYDYRGHRVEIAIDDMDFQKFEKDLKIKARFYHQVGYFF